MVEHYRLVVTENHSSMRRSIEGIWVTLSDFEKIEKELCEVTKKQRGYHDGYEAGFGHCLGLLMGKLSELSCVRNYSDPSQKEGDSDA